VASHADHDHPKTKEARATCRALQKSKGWSSDLKAWTLRDFKDLAVINWHGTYGYPVVHRQAHVPNLEGTVIPSRVVEDLWIAETYRRDVLGQKKYEFCMNCVCFKKKAAA
jgi:hypothetical protein